MSDAYDGNALLFGDVDGPVPDDAGVVAALGVCPGPATCCDGDACEGKKYYDAVMQVGECPVTHAVSRTEQVACVLPEAPYAPGVVQEALHEAQERWGQSGPAVRWRLEQVDVLPIRCRLIA